MRSAPSGCWAAATCSRLALAAAERRLRLLAIDRCWAEHLTELAAARDEIHLVGLDGRLPIAEFYKIAIAAFDRLLARIDDETLAGFDGLQATGDLGELESPALAGPAATWTYLVSDQVFDANVLRTLALRPGLGLWGVLLLGPLLFAWGLWLRWRRSRPRS